MNSVDEFARLKAEIRDRELRVKAMRDAFLRGNCSLRSNQFEVVITQQKRRRLDTGALPQSILENPDYWRESSCVVVSVKPIAAPPQRHRTPPEDDFDLIEPF